MASHESLVLGFQKACDWMDPAVDELLKFIGAKGFTHRCSYYRRTISTPRAGVDWQWTCKSSPRETVGDHFFLRFFGTSAWALPPEDEPTMKTVETTQQLEGDARNQVVDVFVRYVDNGQYEHAWELLGRVEALLQSDEGDLRAGAAVVLEEILPRADRLRDQILIILRVANEREAKLAKVHGKVDIYASMVIARSLREAENQGNTCRYERLAVQ